MTTKRLADWCSAVNKDRVYTVLKQEWQPVGSEPARYYIPLNENSIDCEQFAEYIFNRKEFSLQRIEAYFQHFTFENKVKETFLLEKIGDNN